LEIEELSAVTKTLKTPIASYRRRRKREGVVRVEVHVRVDL